ncbi:uncharacterized protein LOC128216037 [Mya arenaria]|uniref:uncharacterized protein LOC128216037 n=1 Tax=Mya arenaria TaxID=6604 RepID=UPI0022E6007C|nr:uncharacterized protein LOC128216037 [Mya arenaria]
MKEKKEWHRIAGIISSLGFAIRSAEEVSNKWQNIKRIAKEEVTSEKLQRRECGRGLASLKVASEQSQRIVSVHGNASFSGITGGTDTDENDGLSYIANIPSVVPQEGEEPSDFEPPCPTEVKLDPCTSSLRATFAGRASVPKRKKPLSEEVAEWQIRFFKSQVALSEKKQKLVETQQRVLEKYERRMDNEDVDSFIKSQFFN